MSAKILVIEDEYSLREDILEILRYDKFDVYGAENGLTGVQKAREIQPDLVICDVMMPELDGYGVLLELRSDPRTANIPFIFLTARASRADMRRGMEIGADDYLTKPFTQPELLKAIQTRLAKQASLAREYGERMEELRHNIIQALPHELRTPLTGIFGYARMLMEDAETMPPDHIYQMAEGIDRSAKRLHRLVENYLLYAQIELLAANPEQLALVRQRYIHKPAVIIETAAKLKAREAERLADLHLELSDQRVLIAEEALLKIMQELLDNAFKFSPAGMPVIITTWREGDFYHISIRDHGRGMSAEEIERVGAYMQFQRRIYEQGGLGLGLVLARRLTELMGGRMGIYSAPQAGIEVHLTFPLDEAEG